MRWVRALEYARTAAVIIGGVLLVSWLVSTKPDLPWAELSEFHAKWSTYGRHKVQISVRLDKHQECRRVTIVNRANLLQGNTVLPAEIALISDLAERMNAAPLGRSTVFAEATPKSPPLLTSPPTQYQIVLIATCEPPDSTVNLASNAVRVTIVINADAPPSPLGETP